MSNELTDVAVKELADRYVAQWNGDHRIRTDHQFVA